MLPSQKLSVISKAEKTGDFLETEEKPLKRLSTRSTVAVKQQFIREEKVRNESGERTLAVLGYLVRCTKNLVSERALQTKQEWTKNNIGEVLRNRTHVRMRKRVARSI